MTFLDRLKALWRPGPTICEQRKALFEIKTDSLTKVSRKKCEAGRSVGHPSPEHSAGVSSEEEPRRLAFITSAHPVPCEQAAIEIEALMACAAVAALERPCDSFVLHFALVDPRLSRRN